MANVKTKLVGILKSGLLVLASSLFVLAVFGGFYEYNERGKFNAWRAQFNNEGMLGTVSVASTNPEQIWKYRPYGDSPHFKIHTNRWGFRDQDFETKAKPPGVYRVGFVGDSITMGWMTDPGRIFEAMFSAEVNFRHPKAPVQALNFGVDGYDAFQVFETLKDQALTFNLDRVVYVMCVNDFDTEDSSGLKKVYFRPPTSFFVRDIERGIRGLFDIDYHLYFFMRNKTKVYRKILEMRDVALLHGAAFEVAIIPGFYPMLPTFDRYPLAGMHREIDAFLKTEQIETVDLLPYFVLANRAPITYSMDFWHPNDAGHAFIGHVLANMVPTPATPTINGPAAVTETSVLAH